MRNSNLKRIEFSNTHEDTEGTWAISYGDMITLLLSFFVIFFSFDYKKEKEVRLDNSALGNLSGFVFKGESELSRVESTVPQEIIDTSSVVKKISDGKLMVFFPHLSFFASAQTTLTPEGRSVVRGFAKQYMKYAGKFKVKVIAYTDSRKVRARYHHRFKDNLELSVLRSVDVMRTLKESGVPGRRIELGGHGVLNPKYLSQLIDKPLNQKEIESISRTVAFLLIREDA